MAYVINTANVSNAAVREWAEVPGAEDGTTETVERSLSTEQIKLLRAAQLAGYSFSTSGWEGERVAWLAETDARNAADDAANSRGE